MTTNNLYESFVDWLFVLVIQMFSCFLKPYRVVCKQKDHNNDFADVFLLCAWDKGIQGAFDQNHWVIVSFYDRNGDCEITYKIHNLLKIPQNSYINEKEREEEFHLVKWCKVMLFHLRLRLFHHKDNKLWIQLTVHTFVRSKNSVKQCSSLAIR